MCKGIRQSVTFRSSNQIKLNLKKKIELKLKKKKSKKNNKERGNLMNCM